MGGWAGTAWMGRCLDMCVCMGSCLGWRVGGCLVELNCCYVYSKILGINCHFVIYSTDGTVRILGLKYIKQVIY